MVVKPEGSRKLTIAGWVISGLISALLCFSASGKFMQPPQVVESATHFGLPIEKFAAIGVVELACTVLFLIPRTAFVGAILLAGYLGGATVTHLRVGDPWILPVVIGVLVWVAYGLRRPDVILAAFGPRPRAD
jgi:uncharacterized membrane protein YphA (DoxX/SURF4 family)